jgi:hypothetical protein
MLETRNPALTAKQQPGLEQHTQVNHNKRP